MATARKLEGAQAQVATARVEALIGGHGPALMRVAHHFSLCTDDALDAYQRALEIYLRRLATVDPATEGAWMKVVVKHEAMAIRKARAAAVDRDEVDVDATVPAAGREPDERLASGERVGRSVEALRTLKPDEARALLLKAEGLSYAEIGERFGWTYTKVNRSITEGRARFMKAYRGIESGAACDEHADAVAAVAAGEASSAELVALRPHLRHCAFCRAAIRDLHLSRPRRAALALPLPAAALQWLARVPELVPAAMAGGGGRIPAAAAAVAIGIGSAGAATHALPHGAPPPARAAQERPAPRPTPASAPAVRRKPRATPTASPVPVRHRPPRPRRRASEPVPTPTPAPAGEFGIETAAAVAPARTATPAPVPRPARPTAGAGEFGFEREQGTGGTVSQNG
jgi:RNA polymerase sigma factor (sigma-70 family)